MKIVHRLQQTIGTSTSSGIDNGTYTVVSAGA